MTKVAMMPREVSGSWTLLSAASHGADELIGTTRLFRTEKRLYQGKPVDIPVITGNAVRGMWRRACALSFLDAYIAAGGAPVSLSAFYYLTSGGSLRKGGSMASGLDMGRERELREMVPYVGLFGGAGLGNIQPGKLKVLSATLICRESVDLLALRWPEVRDAESAGISSRSLLQLRGYSRQDDAKNQHLHRYLDAAARKDAAAALQRVQTSDTADDAGASQQMRFETMELIAGSVLHHGFHFSFEPTVQEAAGFAAGLMRWSEWAHAGGKSGSGSGMLVPRYHGATPEVKLLASGDGDAVASIEKQTVEEVVQGHIRTNLEEIGAMLGAL